MSSVTELPDGDMRGLVRVIRATLPDLSAHTAKHVAEQLMQSGVVRWSSATPSLVWDQGYEAGLHDAKASLINGLRLPATVNPYR